MKEYPEPLNLKAVKVFPLAERRSLSSLKKMLIDPSASIPECGAENEMVVEECARKVVAARERGSSVMLIYGAHLIKNGGMRIMNELLRGGWITHLATNGAGTIHDWELSYLGRTEESVRENVAKGCFGTWDETGRNIQLALLAGALRGEGYGRSLGRFIMEDGVDLPTLSDLERGLREDPRDPLAPAWADLLHVMLQHRLDGGKVEVKHPWKETSILAEAFRLNISMTVHPGIGYDIIATHPMYSGAAVGRVAGLDFGFFGRAVEGLDGGVVFSVGSAIMGPQVFEKSISCVNNLRLQAGRSVVQGHSIYVVDIQDGGQWDWAAGEPPKTNPAYYLRFCKSYARMGGNMRYVQCDNVTFLHHLLNRLKPMMERFSSPL